MTMVALIGGNFGRAQAATHSAVMPGLDPGIHQTSNGFREEDGLPGEARQ
jgi:hypothetical protein